ncbi:MAG: cysteine--tRNA ligase [Thaumarchaeota archaeon]|nr:cysteine--tRNA ligase [Nitrososphaerota archaeon]
MSLRLYDTLSGRKKNFESIKKGEVTMFVCGPTVYDHVHMGHARTFVFYDVLARYLQSLGFRVTFVMNLTDMDEKIFNRAKREGKPHEEISKLYAEEFRQALRSLNVSMISKLESASDYLESAILQVKGILENRGAYLAEGNVYFDTSKFPDYGKLSHQSPLELKLRMIEPSPEKRSQTDFLLWKKFEEHPYWESPFGKGRPGWHIEDTAIAISNLGQQYDIHGGGVELVFPHHEAEIAQAEVLTGKKPYVRYWVHTGLLKIRGKKMSKSLGNYILVKDILKKYSANAIRLFSLSTHYRQEIDFSERALKKAAKDAELISKAWVTLQRKSRGSKNLMNNISAMEKRFYKNMNDNVNTPKAIQSMISLAKMINEKSDSFDAQSNSTAKRVFGKMLEIFGISA